MYFLTFSIFPPDGSLVAMGSHDGNIYLFSLIDEGFFRKYRDGILTVRKVVLVKLTIYGDGGAGVPCGQFELA